MKMINIMSKDIADELHALGFKYKILKTNDGVIYTFIGTKELMEHLNSHYDKGSFFMSKYMNFAM